MREEEIMLRHGRRPLRKHEKTTRKLLRKNKIRPLQRPAAVIPNAPDDLQSYLPKKPKLMLKKYNKRQRWDAILDRIPDGVHIVGVEIGVLKANTAHRLLVERPLLKHFMIDPWCVPDTGSSYDLSNDTNAQKTQAQHEADYQKTVSLTKFAGARAIIMRNMSHEVVDQFEDESLDFVFIDGDHSYDGVKTDMEMWLQKVKKGGWIGGHDYDHPRLPGVKRAVDEFFKARMMINQIELDDNRTWFVRL